MQQHTYDVVIVGGGAAGLSAALVLGRARRSVAVVDAGTPRNAPAAHMQGFLSRDGMSPSEFLAAGRAEIARYGVEFIAGIVRRIEPGFVVHLDGGASLEARRILVTTGVGDQLPDIPGVHERWGRDLLHCPYCHGYELRDRRLGVLSVSPASVQQAMLVADWGPTTFFLNGGPEPDGTALAALRRRGVALEPGTVRALHGEADGLSAVELAHGRMY